MIAKSAFFAIEANPYNTDIIKKAHEDLVSALNVAPEEPWTLIGLSRLLLNAGYIHGDKYKIGSYSADSIAKALELAQLAVDNDPNNSMSHAQLARVQIITGNYRGAWEEVNQAYKLDESGFYPWFLRAVVFIRMRDHKKADEPLTEAENKASHIYQKRWVYDQRNNIARMKGDTVMREKYLKKTIALLPNEATPLGNYAEFLKAHKRYEEAITTYKKAITINPYPIAVEGLKQAVILRDATAEQNKILEADKIKRAQ